MKFYLQYDVDNDKYFLSETNTIAAGSIVPDAAGGEKEIDYILDFRETSVLRDSVSKIYLYFAVTGTVAITPIAMMSVPTYPGGQTTPVYEEVVISESIATRNTGGQSGDAFTWEFQINNNYPLEDSKLILRIHLQDTRTGSIFPSSITLDNTSYIEVDVKEGETQSIQVHTTSNFKVFQVTERIFGWSSVTATEEINLPVFLNANNKEDVNLVIYTNTDAKENVSFELGTTVETDGPFNETLPHVTDIEIGDFILPTWSRPDSEVFKLRKKENLYNLVEEVSTDYQIRIPPPPTIVPFSETALSNAAENMVETFEMLKALEDNTVPGGSFRIFYPGPLSGGTTVFENGEWQLPLGFTIIDYWTPFSITPVDNLRSVETGSSLWFCLRHRIVGASISAYYREREGYLALRKKITSTEEVRVWMWDTASSPFDITLYSSNRITQKPGFAGKSAALMLV